ncbi:hypothetical protein ACFOY2_05415 [Nonomuraea purpurea]|uniref:Minor tail protein n=1 Tax=Nonomuraea purpurea TaxID=1849276 RepID=A0ABV8G0L6_9ACTN
MAITQDAWFVDSYVKRMRNQLSIDLGDTTPGLFKGALYTGAVVPAFSQTNPAWNVAPWNAGETSGPGYTSGGQDLTVTGFTMLAATNKVGWQFATVTWTATTISAEGLLIYCPSLTDRAFLFRYFEGAKTTSDGDFEIAFHADGAWRTVLRDPA